MQGSYCPISTEKIDGRTDRVGAVLTGALLVSYVVTALWPLLAIAVVDYALRVLGPRPSPLTWVAGRVVRGLGLAVKPVDRAPKLFAWRLGLLMAANALLLAALGSAASLWVAAILAALGLADGVLNVCVGCILYNHVVRPWRRREPGAAEVS